MLLTGEDFAECQYTSLERFGGAMSRVLVERTSDYDDFLREKVFHLMDEVGGVQIEKGSRVLVKPNLLAPASPGRAVVTHPNIVKAVVEYVLQKKGRPTVSDSPATGSFSRVLRASGIPQALEGLPVEFKEFSNSMSVDVGAPFHSIEIAKDVLEADLIINLPKLKTHSQMLLTLGVKNMFGCIVGLRKPQWHMRTGVDRESFARLLFSIYEKLRPFMTLLDGVVGLEGQGPGYGGRPRRIGVLMASGDAVALDMVVCRMLGIHPEELLTNKAAIERGADAAAVEVEGVLPVISDFKTPQISTLLFGPSYFHGFQRRHLVQRPVSAPSLCRLCGECWEYCPAGAIRLESDAKHIHFDYDRCIRCYCCIEVCPHGALHTQEPFLGKAFRRIIGTVS
jgi:uncharacterized protein (DUF362 family)/Pyruvate/2-oxoacid:ferredoxin oxidoreductase delta subunit